jgi:ribosomal protein S18 acetylase RimI-like enzyme
MQGREIGHSLILTFEESSKQLGFKAMRLSVYPDNIAARSLYEKMNWLPFHQKISCLIAMYYYKLLF